MDTVFERMRQLLMLRLEHDRELSDEEIYRTIDELLMEKTEGYVPLSKRAGLRVELFNAVRRLDILQELIDDDRVTEIMVNGTDAIFTERAGVLSRWEKSFSSREKLVDIVQQIVARCNRVANEANAIVDARLENGARVSVVMSPVALNGPILTIRRFPDHPITMEDLIRWGSISREASEDLADLVRAGYNIFISGGTGSGKTTFLNCLCTFIASDERLIVIEDNAELQIHGIENLVRLEARRPNEEGENAVTIRDLIRASLRMRPTRIIVGEVRGEETIDMLQAMNTGHDGSLSTGHGNSPQDMLMRLETMILMGSGFDMMPLSAIRRQIASGLDILIHLSRFRDHTRRVLEIDEIDGYDYQTGEIRLHSLYEFREQGTDQEGKILGSLERTGSLKDCGKLLRAGIRSSGLMEAGE